MKQDGADQWMSDSPRPNRLLHDCVPTPPWPLSTAQLAERWQAVAVHMQSGVSSVTRRTSDYWQHR